MSSSGAEGDFREPMGTPSYYHFRAIRRRNISISSSLLYPKSAELHSDEAWRCVIDIQ